MLNNAVVSHDRQISGMGRGALADGETEARVPVLLVLREGAQLGQVHDVGSATLDLETLESVL